MRLASRKFVIDAEGGVFRLADATFDRMLRDAANHRLPEFSSQRIRMANYLVEVADRRPIRAVWTSYAVLAFDGLGRLDTARLLEQQFARVESALSLRTEDDVGETMVVDAAARFVAHGGMWAPTPELAATLSDAALDRLSVGRLRTVGPPSP